MSKRRSIAIVLIALASALVAFQMVSCDGDDDEGGSAGAPSSLEVYGPVPGEALRLASKGDVQRVPQPG